MLHFQKSGSWGFWSVIYRPDQLLKNFMVIPFVVPEILGGVEPTPPDAIKLSEKADAINR